MAATKIFSGHKGRQGLVIRKDLDWQVRKFQFGAPLFEASNDCEQLFVVDVIIALRGYHALAIVGNWIQDTVVVKLGKYSTGDEV